MGVLNLLNRMHWPRELEGCLLQKAIDHLMLHGHPSIESLIALVRDAIDEFGHARSYTYQNWSEVLLQDIGTNNFLHGTDELGPQFALFRPHTIRLSPGRSFFGSGRPFVCALSPSIRTNGDQETAKSRGATEASNNDGNYFHL